MEFLVLNKKKNKKPIYSKGDFVKIRSAENIKQTLDSFNKYDGCFFMDQMWQYCGQKFRVLKVIRHFFDEYRNKMNKTKSPLYLLDGLICDGISAEFQYRCDRSCFLLWHEDWLERL